MSDREIETWRMEICPVCGNGPNIGGSKYCYGRSGARHDRARWEWVEVVRASALEEAGCDE